MNLIILCAIKSTKNAKKQSKKRGAQKRSRITKASSIDDQHTEIATISTANDNAGSCSATMHTESDQTGTRTACSVEDIDIKIKQDSKITKRERQLTTMTAVMTIAFFICVAPNYVRFAFPYIGSNIVRSWVAIIARNLILLNSAINFFLYAVAGSKFRSDLMMLFRINRN